MKARVNSLLEKKLEELESLLEAITFNNDNPNVYQKLVQGFLFVKKLLEAEISSRGMDVEGEGDVEEMSKLRYMETRLTEIGDFIIKQLPGYDNGSLVEPEIESLGTTPGIVNTDTGSVDSLIESCLNESSIVDEEEEAEQRSLFQDAASEEKILAMATEEEEMAVDREMKEKGHVGFRALVCFGLIGLVGGMISLYGYIGDNVKEDHFFLTPT